MLKMFDVMCLALSLCVLVGCADFVAGFKGGLTPEQQAEQAKLISELKEAAAKVVELEETVALLYAEIEKLIQEGDLSGAEKLKNEIAKAKLDIDEAVSKGEAVFARISEIREGNEGKPFGWWLGWGAAALLGAGIEVLRRKLGASKETLKETDLALESVVGGFIKVDVLDKLEDEELEALKRYQEKIGGRDLIREKIKKLNGV